MTRRARWRLAAAVVVLSVARIAASGAGAPTGPANRAYILALGAAFLHALLGVIDRHTTRPGPTVLDEVAGRVPPQPERPPRLTALEDLAAVGADNAQGTHHHLRPYLRETLRDRLRSRGIELDTDPRVPDLLGPQTWDLVRPDRPEPADGRDPGLTDAQVRAVTDILDRLLPPPPPPTPPPTPPTPPTSLEPAR